MADPFGDAARQSRRERRLINFLVPQLHVNEQIEIIVTVAHEKSTLRPSALVLTTQQIVAVRLEFLTARPKAIVAEHARTSVTAEWDRYARRVGASGYNPGVEFGELSITDSSRVTQTFSIHGERRKDRAQALVAALNAGQA
jgi:hypothetical protein